MGIVIVSSIKGGNVVMNETNKTMCILAYILFFIPLIADSSNEEYRFHANQGLLIFILGIIISVIGMFIPIIGWFIILPLGWLGVLAFCIIGIINAANEEMKELPLIGSIRIIN